MAPLLRPRFAHRQPAGAFRPRLENLEDRTLPAPIFWINPAGGDWSTPSNWSTGALPGVGDDVVIDVPGNATIAHSHGTDAVHSVTSENPLALSGGALDVAAASALDGTFTFTDGTLSGSGDVAVNGALVWAGGTMTGSGHTLANGGLALSNTLFGPSTTLNGRELDNAGAAVWTRGNITFRNGAIFNNLADATFDAQADAEFLGLGSGPGTFINNGTFRKVDSSGSSAFLQVACDNLGAVDVQTGQLDLNGGGASTGSFVVRAGAILGLIGRNYTLEASSSVSGSGTVFIVGNFPGTMNLLGAYSVATTTLAGGTVNFGHDATTNTLNLRDGTLTGPGAVTVTGLLNWTGGTMSGPGSTTSTGTLTIGDFPDKVLSGRVLNNAGTATWLGTSFDVAVTNGGVINNLAGATFTVMADATLGATSGASGTFNNAGLFVKSASSDQTSINILFNNSGMVDVQTGTLRLGSGTSSGSFAVDGPGTNLVFAGNHTLTRSSVVAGDGDVELSGFVNVSGFFGLAGTVTVSGGTVNLAANVHLPVLAFTGGAITGNGDLIVEDVLTWTGGTMSGLGATVSLGYFSLAPALPSGVTLARPLYNSGTAVFTGMGTITIVNTVLHNQAGATFLAQGNGTFVTLFGSGIFDNAGDFRKVASSGSTLLNLTFNNAGSVEVETGTLVLNGPGDSTGSLSVSAGATLVFPLQSNIPYLLEPSSSVTGAGVVWFGAPFFGTGSVRVAGSYAVANTRIRFGTVLFASDASVDSLALEGGDLAGPGNVTVTGLLNWTGGSMSGAGNTTTTGALTIGGSSSKTLAGRFLRNAGTASWRGTGGIMVSGGTVLDNTSGATFLIESDTFLNVGTGTFLNEGLLRKQASSGTTTIAIPFVNSGTVEVSSGTLRFTGAYTQTAGATVLSGGTLTANGGVLLEGGSLSGTGTVNGDVINAALVSPGGDGAVGTLTINGNYTQTATGTLSIDLGGLNAGTGYDQLVVSGLATFGGTLSVHLIDGFVPPRGWLFAILLYGSHAGTFATVDLPRTGELFYGGTDAILQFA